MTFKEKDEEIRRKLDDMWFEIGEKGRLAKKWIRENKSIIVLGAPFVFHGAVDIIKLLMARNNIQTQKRLKDCYIYDKFAGHFYELKRKPTSEEWLKIDHSLRYGIDYSVGEILKAFDLLK